MPAVPFGAIRRIRNKLGGSSVAGFSPTRESERLSEFDQCGVTDVPWLAEEPTTMTIQPGQSRTVVVTFSATTAAEVTQPGTYTAQIVVNANTPTRVDPIDVTMNVTPPKDWGKIAGTVTGVDCEGNSAPLQGVQVQAKRQELLVLAVDRQGRRVRLLGTGREQPVHADRQQGTGTSHRPRRSGSRRAGPPRSTSLCSA